MGLPNNSYKSITNTAWVRSRHCKLQKGCTRLAAASDKVYQLLAHGRWFSPASSTTKTGRHDIAEILLKVVLNTTKSINQSTNIMVQPDCGQNRSLLDDSMLTITPLTKKVTQSKSGIMNRASFLYQNR